MWTAALSGLLGFATGFWCLPSWQVAVETAQVIAGLVRYPADNPFYIYHVKLWTILHQVLALLLRAGVSEVALSQALSGVVGMISLQALALLIYAFSRDAVYSAAAAFVVFLSGAAQFSGTYPIDLMGTSHTYGAIGLSAMVLTFAAFGAGAYRTGGLLLGVMPAIHPSLGIWSGVIGLLCLFPDPRRIWREIRPSVPWFAAGAAITLASFAAYLWAARGVTPVPRQVADRYVDAFISFWDGHRRMPDLQHPGIYLNNPAVRLTTAAVPVAFVWLRMARTLPRSAELAVRFVLASASLSAGFVAIGFTTGGWLPRPIQILMPMRLLNIAGMAFVPMMFGVLGAWRRRRAWIDGAVLALMAALLLADKSRVLGLPAFARFPRGWSAFTIVLIAMIAFTAYAFVDLRRRPDGSPRLSGGMPSVLSATRTAAVIALIAYWIPLSIVSGPRPLIYRDRTHDPVFGAAAAAGGILATGDGLHLIQLRTRRPVLIDGGGLDGLMYSVDGAPAMDRILRQVYGVDLVHPSSDDGRGTGSMPAGTNLAAWQGFSRARWSQIRRDFGVTQVMTPAAWAIDLPLVVETQDLRLYEIPQ